MEILTLQGNWTLKRLSDGSSRPMPVPGDILSALIASGEAPDPYYDRNELGLQWIGREDWLIERDLEVPASLLKAERLFLELDMVDTLADISVNGEALGSSENMFASFRADAKRLLRAGTNHIAVLIHSPEAAAMKAAEELPYPIPASGAPVFSPKPQPRTQGPVHGRLGLGAPAS